MIEDPLAMAADMYLTTSPDARHLARMAVESAVASMTEIEELLDARVVRTFAAADSGISAPIVTSLHSMVFDDHAVGLTESDIWEAFEAGYVEGLDPRLQTLWQQIRAGNRHPPLTTIEDVAKDGDVEMLRLFIEVLEHLRPRGVVENALDVAAAAIGDAVRLNGALDLLCPSLLFARLVTAAATGLDDLRLHELVRADVPGIDALLANDAVAIRLHSDAFDTWRTDLSIALERASQLRDRLGPDTDTSEVIRDSIGSARSRVFGEINRSTALSDRVGNWVSFVAGMLCGAIGNSTGGTAGAAMGAVGATVPPLVRRATRRWRAPAGFLKRHYLVFERPSSTQPG